MQQIDTLCCVGGGLKVYAMCGSILELEKSIILSQIKRYIGSSSGSIICLLLNLEFTGNEILEYLNNNNVKNVNETFCGITNIFRQLYNLKNHYGLNRSTIIEDSIKNALIKSGFSKECTFLDLYNKTLKTLTITATSISNRETFYFNYITMPQMKIVDAISMSTSYPVFFTAKSYIINDKKHIFADGGIINNFPILYYSLCDTNGEMFLNKIDKISKESREILLNTPMPTTLGIYLLNKNYSQDISDLYQGFDTISSLNVYINSLLKSMSDKIDNLNLMLYHSENVSIDIWKYIIPIQLPFEINPIRFNVSNDTKNLMLNSGISCTKKYIENFSS
jgi:patatin-like phospholipase/acyl hydrolase